MNSRIYSGGKLNIQMKQCGDFLTAFFERPEQETDGENAVCATGGVKLSGIRDTLRMELWKGRGQVR